MNRKDCERLKKQIGPYIWSGSDLLKAFSVGVLLGLLLMSPLALANNADYTNPLAVLQDHQD
jgi:hypothetical protein